jgi:S1-C subfamily serine protease
MSKRAKIVGLLLALLLLIGLGAAAGGGIVYAMTRARQAGGLTIYADDLGPESGIVVASVVPDGPAAEAGVARGDILLEVEGESVDSVADLARVLEAHEPGDEVTLSVLHGDDELALEATLGERGGEPYLGIVPCVGIPGEGLSRVLRLDASGAVIVEVLPGSPAASAGLQEGDVILAVDGETLGPEMGLAEAIASREPGDEVTLEVEREGEEPSEIEVELGEDPDQEGKPYLGVRYQRARPFRMTVEGMPFGGHQFWGPMFVVPGDESMQGVLIRQVAAGSPAEDAGLSSGDAIAAVDGEPVQGPQDLVDAVAEREPGATLTLTVYQGGEDEPRDVEVTLGEDPAEAGKPYLGVEVGGFVRMHRFHGDGEPWPRRQEMLEELHEEWEAPFDEDLLPHLELIIPDSSDDAELDCYGSSI